MLGGAIAFGVSAWLEASAAEDARVAAARAGDSGLRTDLEAALATLGDPDDPELRALKARLLATLVLEHDADRAEEARAILSRLPVADRSADAAIASALLAVDQGDPSAALQVLSGLTAEGEQISEAFRARALATAALGRWAQAEEAATRAAQARPSGPRHVALQARMRHRTDRSSEALTLLDGVPGGAEHPGVRLARARILRERDGSAGRAAEEAAAVLEALAERATPHQLAWAHLLRAESALEGGDAETALEEARAAAEHPPPGDETFARGLVRALLGAGAAAEARAKLDALPPPTVDPAGRARLTAEVALAVGDLDRAEQALPRAPDGPVKRLLEGRLAEARGRPDDARSAYEGAMGASGAVGRRARVRLAALELRRGRARRALELLEPARAEAADDVELVSLLARAYLAEGRLEDAQAVLDAALERRPEASELLAARGALELRRGRAEEALATLRRVVEARPEDPDLQADLGRAARLAGETDAARAAFEAALERRADHPRALLGLARLALDQGELEAAERRLDAAAEAGAEDLEVARLRARLAVTRGAGAAGVDAVARLAEAHDHAELWTALGALQAQAEQDRDAARSFARAQRRDRRHPRALLGESLLEIRDGDLRGARRAIATAEREARRRGRTERLTPAIAVAKGRLELELGDFGEAIRLAERALERDDAYGPAHLLLASVAIARGDDGVEHLRRAVEGHTTPPEALGRLAIRLRPGTDEACQLAQRYLEVAPEGYDASDVRRAARRCR